ncbi:hypothetical protein KBB96_08545 [Luteolibacter ambystomatis]|uniref:PEP-CTERM sorting domain-containing protein n=1 Tax=Luteolibacter ambystomatis TaxID=2824561 RepID=A0A975J2N5_9BACT|nr:hypothetical protein [Luteolibacter ambystomatis]QUE52927.1 hypothetical protein KBB96_08545 [Luteolibacter ambystomatis]
MKSVFVLMLFLTVAGSQAATLVLTNGSFETGLSGWTTTATNITNPADPQPFATTTTAVQHTNFGTSYARLEGSNSVLAQTLASDTIQAGIYTLTWYSTDAFDDGGNNSGGRAITGGLYVGGTGSTTLLGGTATTVAGATIANLNDLGGTGTQFTYTYTVLPGDPNIGQPMSVRFTGGAIGFGGFGQVAVDNVSVDFVPEPSAALLGALGLLGLLRRRR